MTWTKTSHEPLILSKHPSYWESRRGRGWGRGSGWRDLNPRPLRPERSALPSCATPRGKRDKPNAGLMGEDLTGKQWRTRILLHHAVREILRKITVCELKGVCEFICRNGSPGAVEKLLLATPICELPTLACCKGQQSCLGWARESKGRIA